MQQVRCVRLTAYSGRPQDRPRPLQGALLTYTGREYFGFTGYTVELPATATLSPNVPSVVTNPLPFPFGSRLDPLPFLFGTRVDPLPFPFEPALTLCRSRLAPALTLCRLV